jgi:hypothetical protein
MFHSDLIRERPKTVLELYDQFAKFSKFEIHHFRKLEQQRKAPRPDEAPRPATMKIIITQGWYTSLIPREENSRKAGRRVMEHLPI